MLEFGKLLDVVNAGWFSSTVGVVGLLSGIGFFLASRTKAQLSWQCTSIRLIGSKQPEMPSQVTISFMGEVVETLAKSKIVVWNSGKSSIRYSDIVQDDPLRLQFDGMVLQTEILRYTRDVNRCRLAITPERKAAVLIFDFIDPQDGITIEILHTSADVSPRFLGTIRGMPAGIRLVGGGESEKILLGPLNKRVKSPVRRKFARWFVACMAAFIGTGFVAASYIIPKHESGFTIYFLRVAVGVMYVILPPLMLFLSRRRHPKGL